MLKKYYTIKSKTTNKEYSVILCFQEGILIPNKSSCTCKHGSVYRFTQNNIKLGNWKCNHLQIAIKKYENKEPDNIEKEQEEQNERNTKQIYPIF